MNRKPRSLTEGMLNSLIPAQMFSAALLNINAFLNSVITGALLSAKSIAAISFTQPITLLISVLGGAIATGAQVMCGRYIGRGDGKGADRIFTLSALWCLVLGAIMTISCIFFAEPISALMGAEGADLTNCAQYLRGMSGSIIFMMFSTALTTFMQLDNAPNMSMLAITAMVVTSIVFDFINVKVFDMGIFGIGLATTVGYAAVLFVGVAYYASKKCNFKFSFSLSALKESGEMFYIGIPGAASSIALALRAFVLNNLCFRLAGTIGVSAIGVFYSMSGFVSAIGNGVGGAAGILSSVFVGERDRTSLRKLGPMATKKAWIMHAIAYAVVWLTAKPFAILFGTSAGDMQFVVHAIRCSMTCFLVNIFGCVGFNMYKSIGNTWLVSICSILDYFVFQCVAAWLLSIPFGIDGVWFISIFSELATYLIMLLYCRKKLGRAPGALNYVYIPRSISAKPEDCYDVSMKTLEEVEEVSAQVVELCKSKGMDSRRSYFCGLCIEEQCANIILHGMTKVSDASKCSIDLRMIFEDGKVTFSLRDNCRKFDPTSWRRRENETDPMKGVGIKMVQQLAEKVSYRRTFGLNMLLVEI